MTSEIKQRIEQINNGQVPEGYFRTTAGIIPQEWRISPLGSLLEFKNGVNADKGKYGSGIKMISVMDVLKNTPIHYNDIIGQVDIDENTLNTYCVDYGDILFQRSSETAEDAGKSNVYLDNEKTTYSGFVIRGKKKADYCPYFLNEALKKEEVRKQLIRNAAGSQHINIGQESLEKIEVCLPSATEQEKIAEILMKWDKAIELQEKYIEKANQQRIFLLKKVFEPKQNWSYQTLGDNVNLLASGGTPSTKILKYFDGNIVWVSIDDISKSGKYISKSNRTLSLEGLQNSSAKLFPKGTILYAMYASIGKCAIANIDCATSQAIIGIVPSKNSFDNQYLYYYLCSIQERISTQGQQGTQANLNKGLVESFKIPTPMKDGKIDIDEQKRISKILIAIDNTITLNTKKLESIKQQRKALQQYLLNGIVRVEV